MELSAIETDSSYTVFFDPLDSSGLLSQPCAVYLTSMDGHNFSLITSHQHVEAKLRPGAYSDALLLAWRQRQHLLAWVEPPPVQGMPISAKVVPFAVRSRSLEPLHLALPPKICKKLSRICGLKEGEAMRWAEQCLILMLDGEPHLVVQTMHDTGAGKVERAEVGKKKESFDKNTEDRDGNEECEEDTIQEAQTPGLTRFYLYSPAFVLSVHRMEDHGMEFYQVCGLHISKEKWSERGKRMLLQASVRIGRGRQALTLSMRTKLDLLRQQKASYLDLWNRYREQYGNNVLKKGRRFCSPIAKLEQSADNLVVLSISSTQPNTFERGEDVLLVQQIPTYLSEDNQQLSWPELLAKGAPPDLRSSRMLAGKVVEVRAVPEDGTRLMVKPTESLNVQHREDEGKPLFVIPDIHADLTQLMRQQRAYDAICEGTSGNCFLAQIIEKDSPYTAQASPIRIPAESRFVHRKLFEKRSLTATQKEAIELALNTPDIVLIQGPPGTGKTTVITGIIERLNELRDKSRPVQGQVLVTSFQHDAVENLIERLSVNSLPTIKFGHKSAEDASMHSEEHINRMVGNWADKVAEALRCKYSFLAEADHMDALQTLVRSYVQNPSNTQAANLLNLMIDGPVPLDEKMRDKLEYVRTSILGRNESLEDKSLLRAIYALRTEPVSFRDDGAVSAAKLHIMLTRRGETDESCKELKILEKAASTLEPSPQLLTDLKSSRLTLLERFSPAPQFSIAKPREDVLSCIEDYRELMRETVQDRALTCEDIVRRFYRALVSNPASIRDAIESYNFVYSATNQQVLGKEISRKKIGQDTFRKRNVQESWRECCGVMPEMFYDTVIVDEAAKSAPPDLMIPMALATGRIILVGDHRQLPHMLDDEIAASIENEGFDESLLGPESLNLSMFEYLKERLEELERRDGIRRTITLDKQYRTHPDLGEMVSRFFYEDYDEGYESPLPSCYFSHNLPSTGNAPCVWIEVPGLHAAASRDAAGSLYRTEEAGALVKWLKLWMDSPEGASLTFGVITFYKAQRDAILKEMDTQGMRDSQTNILSKYARLKRDNQEVERLRIGTVDSFQGMEFDVVILSMVRTSGVLKRKSAHPFGFLEYPNRLCVALSRQKKMLAIVGDSNLVNSEACRERKKSVAILSEFYDMCAHKYHTVIS